jgi:hypothetical protein
MVERDIVADTPEGVSAFAEEVLGETFVGEEVSGGDNGDHYGSNG